MARAALIREELKDQPKIRAEQMDVIGNVCRSRGMFKEARPLLEEALRIRQQLDPNDAQVASSLHNLAWLDFDTGNWKIAEQLYRQALAIRARQSGREGELAAANTKFNLAWLLGQSNRAREAEGLFREVLAVRTKHLGLGHRDVKIAAFAVILVRQPGPSDLLKEVDTVAAAVGPGEVAGMLSVGMTYFRAATLRRQGKYADAEPLYREVLAQASASTLAATTTSSFPCCWATMRGCSGKWATWLRPRPCSARR